MNNNSQQFEVDKIELIVGLGNIGLQYARTRHNAGFLFLDSLTQNEFLEETKFKALVSKVKNEHVVQILAKPTTLMNLSGESVSSIASYYKIKPESILIVHDDLDIKLGEHKIQFATGPKVHNGILSVEQHLGTKDFWRLRIGIDNRTKEEKDNMSGEDYVLGRFKIEEQEILEKTFQEIQAQM